MGSQVKTRWERNNTAKKRATHSTTFGKCIHVHVCAQLLTSSCREYIFFQSPVRDYFQWKIGKKFLAINKKNLSMKLSPDTQINAFSHCPPCGIIFSDKSGKRFRAINFFFLSMKRSLDTQINAFSHWHLEISMASFLLWSCFFSTIKPLASSDATAYYRPAPGRTDGIPDRDERPHVNGYKSVFTNSWLVTSKEQVLDKGIRQKSTKRVNTFVVCSAFCPGPRPPNCDPMDSEKRLRAYKSAAAMARHTCWQVSRPHAQKSECVFKGPTIYKG